MLPLEHPGPVAPVVIARVPTFTVARKPNRFLTLADGPARAADKNKIIVAVTGYVYSVSYTHLTLPTIRSV